MNCIKLCLPGKSILGDYYQENRTSRRPFLLLRISFPGSPIFIQLPSRALYSANDVKPHQSQSFQTLEEISSILISEMKKKPRKEKALRDGLELQVESDRKLFRHNILPNISTEYSAETEQLQNWHYSAGNLIFGFLPHIRVSAEYSVDLPNIKAYPGRKSGKFGPKVSIFLQFDMGIQSKYYIVGFFCRIYGI